MNTINYGGFHFLRLRQLLVLVLVPRPRPRILAFLHAGQVTRSEPLLAIPSPTAIASLSPLAILALAALTIVSFHLAYVLPQGGFLMLGYLFGLFSLSQLRTSRQAFYLGFGIGLAVYAPHLAFFWTIFGVPAIVLWSVLAFWLGLFLLLSRAVRCHLGAIGAAVLIPCLWTGLEYFRSELYYLRFTWLNVGYALSYRRVTDALVRQGAEALIVPTMDIAEWGRYQHQLHGRVAKVRAAEFGLPIFRVCSSGLSQLTDRQGQVIASAPFPGEYATLAGSLELAGPGRLPWDHWGAPLAVGITIAISAYLAAYEIWQFFINRRSVGRATTVAQVSNLLYRGFPIRRRFAPRTVCRLEVGDTADWKSALRSRGLRRFQETLTDWLSAPRIDRPLGDGRPTS